MARPVATERSPAAKARLAFVQVHPVRLQVKQVIENVGCRSEKAEAEEGDDGGQDKPRADGMGQQQRQENEQILGPLMHPEGLRQGYGGAKRSRNFSLTLIFRLFRALFNLRSGLATIACWALVSSGKSGRALPM